MATDLKSISLYFGTRRQMETSRSSLNILHLDSVVPSSSIVLVWNDGWNDFGFRTTFSVFLRSNDPHDLPFDHIGETNIGFVGQEIGPHSYAKLGEPSSLDRLPPEFFSLGQSVAFYGALVDRLGESQAINILNALGDVLVGEPSPDYENEEVFRTSLTRSGSAREAFDVARSLFSNAGPEGNRSELAFTATIPIPGARVPHVFDFDFSERAGIPTNINLLVGVNGTGKTKSLGNLGQLLSGSLHLGKNAKQQHLEELGKMSTRASIYRFVAVSFSAFDDFVEPEDPAEIRERLQYVHCRLNDTDGAKQVEQDFNALSEADQMKALAPVLPVLRQQLHWVEGDEVVFENLSAGQRILLGVTTSLVQHVDRGTLVMMDEPELHLHPQLISALTIWLADFLKKNESFAIVATHSPSMVQQVPSSCVHVLEREGSMPFINKPQIETFGANLSDIVREVFQDLAGEKSYQNVLRALHEQHGTAAAVNGLFDNRLGSAALMFLSVLDAR